MSLFFFLKKWSIPLICTDGGIHSNLNTEHTNKLSA